MNNPNRKKPGQPEPDADSERRKVGMVVHDDRGNASVSWRDAPAGFDRPVLEVLGDPGLSIQSEKTYDPYARRGLRRADEDPWNTGHVDTRSGGPRGSHPHGTPTHGNPTHSSRPHSGHPHGGHTHGGGNRGNTSRTNLRKLSEWIKMMRELEQRKREDGGEGESGV